MDEMSDNSLETQKLLKQVRSGDTEALSRIFALYRTYLRKVIEMRMDARLQKRVDASDIVQETQLEAARRLADYLEKEPVPFRLWLRQIALDRLSNARQRHIGTARRTASREVSLPERSSLLLAEQLLAGGSTPSQHVAKQEQVRHVREVLAKLPEADREILLMRNLEKLSYKEIGCVMGIDTDAAKMRHVRALQRLSEIMRDNGLTESQL